MQKKAFNFESELAKFSHPLDSMASEYKEDSFSKLPVLHVKDLVGFIQAAGYIKYKLSLNRKSVLFFRGQNKMYPFPFQPGLFRGLKQTQKIAKKMADVRSIVTQIKTKSKNLSRLDDSVVEGLLQQYGVQTSWVDVVDNLWIALWFACHTATPLANFVHFEIRTPRREEKEDRFVYILLLGLDVDCPCSTSSYVSGLVKGIDAEYLDLRYALPSHYIRPHIQHGVLIRARSASGPQQHEMNSLVKGIIRVDLEDALEWLGNGHLLSVSKLFLSPMFDTGFKELLETVDKMSFKLQHICP